MKQLMALFTAAVMTMVLSACGEKPPAKPEVANDTAVEQTQATDEEAKPAEEATPVEEEAKPAEESAEKPVQQAAADVTNELTPSEPSHGDLGRDETNPEATPAGGE